MPTPRLVGRFGSLGLRLYFFFVADFAADSWTWLLNETLFLMGSLLLAADPAADPADSTTGGGSVFTVFESFVAMIEIPILSTN